MYSDSLEYRLLDNCENSFYTIYVNVFTKGAIMPKIIKNLENRLIEEANRQIKEAGYGATTIRSIAKACGVGVGTVYNYFSSKEELIAIHLLDDWKGCMTAIHAVSAYSDSPTPVLRCIYDQLCQFARRHENIFRDEGAVSVFAGSFGRYHTLLRQQLAQPLQRFCGDEFTRDFVAEALLTWTMAGKKFDEIYGVISKVI
jgi:AcrR family transcriptional regulator